LNKVYQVRYVLTTKYSIENYFPDNEENVVYSIKYDTTDENNPEIFLKRNSFDEDRKKYELSIFVIYQNHDDSKVYEYRKDALCRVKKFISILEMTTDFEPSIKLDESSSRPLEYDEKGSANLSKEFNFGIEVPQLNRSQKEIFKNSFSNLFFISNRIYQYLDKHNDKHNFFLLALKYYSRSKLYRTQITDIEVKEFVLEKEFLDLIFCLEFLFSEGSTDISYKIVNRGCLIYSLTPDDDGKLSPLELYELIKTAYSKRSNIVHGTKSEDIDENYIR
jgi:hypothetical protein